MLILKYNYSLWSRKITGQLLSFFYSIPIMLIILCSSTQMLMPITSNIIFESNAQYKYLYMTNYYDIQQGKIVVSGNAQTLLNSENGTKLLYKEDSLLSSGYDPSISTEKNPFYEINSFSDLYIVKDGTDLSRTIFTKSNFISENTPYNSKVSDKPQIYLSYNTAKYLNVKDGDIILSWTAGKYIECVVSGMIKPRYDGTSEGNTPLEYNQFMSFPALLVVDEELYDQHIKFDNSIILVVYSNNKITESNSELKANSKEETLKELKTILKNKKVLIQFILQLLFSLCVVCILLTIEFNFTQKKNAKDIEILGMLGMRTNNIKRILAIHVLITHLFTVLISLIICRYIYFNRLLEMYCEPLVLLSAAIGILFSGILFIILRSIFTKKTI